MVYINATVFRDNGYLQQCAILIRIQKIIIDFEHLTKFFDVVECTEQRCLLGTFRENIGNFENEQKRIDPSTKTENLSTES